MSVAYGRGPKGKATKLHSLVVRSRGACERCGEDRYEKLQAAHIIPRRFCATRTDETAAWALCISCHRRLTEHPDEHMALVFQTIGTDRFDELKKRALAGVKTSDTFWLAECERLQALLAKTEAA